MTVQISPEDLLEETRLLTELTTLLRQARETRPDHAPLTEVLDAQAVLCEQLAERRVQRSEQLEASGYGPRDLLVALLNGRAKDEQQRIVSTFRGFVEAAEQAQKQIDINREFFAVALAAVEDALAAALPESSAPTYEASGSRRQGGSVMVSTTT